MSIYCTTKSSWSGARASLTSHRLNRSVAVVSACGDIDASNANLLTDCALGCAATCHAVILDLRGLDFFGTAGLATLRMVAIYCARAGTQWAAVPSAAVSRMLQIGDPDSELPVVDTVDAALAGFLDYNLRV